MFSDGSVGWTRAETPEPGESDSRPDDPAPDKPETERRTF